MPEPELAPLPDPDRGSAESWQQSDILLGAVDAPKRLSGLLAQARPYDADLPRLVALRALYAVSPPVGVAMRQGDKSLIIAVDDGERLADPELGGADLILGLARVRVGNADAALSDGQDG